MFYGSFQARLCLLLGPFSNFKLFIFVKFILQFLKFFSLLLSFPNNKLLTVLNIFHLRVLHLNIKKWMID